MVSAKSVIIDLTSDKSKRVDGGELDNVQLGTVPRVGDHIELITNDNLAMMYKVIAVCYKREDNEYIDVYVRQDCTLTDLICRLQS